MSDWIQYVTSFSQSCVKGFKGEVGVTGVVEASDDMASLHVIIDSSETSDCCQKCILTHLGIWHKLFEAKFSHPSFQHSPVCFVPLRMEITGLIAS